MIDDLAFGRHSVVIRPSAVIWLRRHLASPSFDCHSIVIRLFTAHCSLPAAHWILVISDYSPQRRRGRRD